MKPRQDYAAFADYIRRAFTTHKNNPRDMEYFAQALRNQIFDMASIPSGYSSISVANTPPSKLTHEHIFPRMQSARFIIKQLERGISRKRLIALIKSRCRIHYTTSQENNLLRKLQRDPTYFWRNGYKQMGIELVPYVYKKPQKYIYKVDDVVYNSISDVAKAFGISKATARDRCVKKAKKSNFYHWIREEINNDC